MRSKSFSWLVICISFFTADFLSAQQQEKKLPLTLQPIWENCAGHHGGELVTAFSPDGKLAYLINDQTKETIARDTKTWKKVENVAVPPQKWKYQFPGTKIISPNGKYGAYATSVYDNKGVEKSGQITFFDPATEKPLASVQAHPRPPVLAFSPDGKTLASGGDDSVILWNSETHQKKLSFKPGAGRAFGLVFNPDGKTLAVNAREGVYPVEMELWDTATGKMILALGGHGAQVWRLAFSPDGKQLVSTGNDPKLRFWIPDTGMNIATLPLNTAHRRPGLAFSPDGKRVAVGDGKVVRIYDAKTYDVLLELKGHSSSVESIAFRPDGKQLASGSRGVVWIQDQPTIEPGEIILWDLPTAKEFKTIKYHANGVNCLAYTPDGKTLVSGGGGGSEKFANSVEDSARAIALWDSATGNWIKSFPADKGYSVTALAISPDGSMIAHNGKDGSVIQLLNFQTGNEIRQLHGANTPSEIAFSRDGKRLAVVGYAGGYDVGKGYIQVFDPNAGKLLAHRIAHKGGIGCVAFDPSGETLVTGGDDRVIWKWAITLRGKAEEIKGIIEKVTVTEKRVSILVKSTTPAQPGKIIFHLTKDTKIVHSNQQKAKPADLKAGQKVIVLTSSGYYDTDPPQAEAGEIEIQVGAEKKDAAPSPGAGNAQASLDQMEKYLGERAVKILQNPQRAELLVLGQPRSEDAKKFHVYGYHYDPVSKGKTGLVVPVQYPPLPVKKESVVKLFSGMFQDKSVPMLANPHGFTRYVLRLAGKEDSLELHISISIAPAPFLLYLVDDSGKLVQHVNTYDAPGVFPLLKEIAASGDQPALKTLRADIKKGETYRKLFEKK